MASRNVVFPESALRIHRNPIPLSGGVHRVDSRYVDEFWGPVVGPTALCLLRKLDRLAAANPDGFEVETYRLALSLGVGHKGGKHGPFWNAINRLDRFSLIAKSGSSIVVPEFVYPISDRQLQGLKGCAELLNTY